MSVNALYIIVVELMASIPPRNMQSIRFQSKACPTTIPSVIIAKIMVSVVITGVIPIFIIFLNEKSRPSENSRNITPMSAQVLMSTVSMTDMVYGMCGLTMKPAMIYPSTSGCLSFLKSSVTVLATIRIRARSLINVGTSDTLYSLKQDNPNDYVWAVFHFIKLFS